MPMNLQAWLGRSVDYLRTNETTLAPPPLRRLLKRNWWIVSALPLAPPDDIGVCEGAPVLAPLGVPLRAAVMAAAQAREAKPTEDWAVEDWALPMAPVSTTYTIATSPTPRSSKDACVFPLSSPRASGKRQRLQGSAVCCRRQNGIRRPILSANNRRGGSVSRTGRRSVAGRPGRSNEHPLEPRS
jgi:hypothetical protein